MANSAIVMACSKLGRPGALTRLGLDGRCKEPRGTKAGFVGHEGRLVANGDQHQTATAATLSHPVSRMWAGYWQRNAKAA